MAVRWTTLGEGRPSDTLNEWTTTSCGSAALSATNPPTFIALREESLGD